MTTILGSHINTVRPKNITPFGIRRSDRPRARYDKSYQSKVIKINTGKVIAVCVRLLNGAIRSVSSPATHIKVMEVYDLEPAEITAVGWQLENGNFLWR